MSKRRTRQQKEVVAAKNAFFRASSPAEAIPKNSAYFASDLTRTILVTILALFLEIMLKLYLERGWAQVASMYCVKCRAKRDDPNAQQVTMKNGKAAMKGKCPVCGTGMYKIGAA